MRGSGIAPEPKTGTDRLLVVKGGGRRETDMADMSMFLFGFILASLFIGGLIVTVMGIRRVTEVKTPDASDQDRPAA